DAAVKGFQYPNVMWGVPPLHKSQAYICIGRPNHEKSLKRITIAIALILSLATLSSGILTHATSKTYDTTTLAGKLASVNDTPGLYFSLSDFLQEEADTSDQASPPSPAPPTPPPPLPSPPLSGTPLQPPPPPTTPPHTRTPPNEPAAPPHPPPPTPPG